MSLASVEADALRPHTGPCNIKCKVYDFQLFLVFHNFLIKFPTIQASQLVNVGTNRPTITTATLLTKIK